MMKNIYTLTLKPQTSLWLAGYRPESFIGSDNTQIGGGSGD